MEENKPEKKKLPYFIDGEGNRRDPNRKGSPIMCNGKSRRTGELCRNLARPNGKCRNHGGNNTGPKTPEGKKKAAEALSRARTKTGEHVPIWYDTLREDEKQMILENSIPKDAHALLDESIMFTSIRERRMMARILELEDKIAENILSTRTRTVYNAELVRDQAGDTVGFIDDQGHRQKVKQMVVAGKSVDTETYEDALHATQEGLTRVQAQKTRLIELKAKLDDGNIDEADGSLNQLVTIIAKAREIRLSRDVGDGSAPITQ